MVERSAVNRRVPGSSPGRGANPSDGSTLFWVYVLMNPQGKIYIGQSSDLSRRLSQHNDPNYCGTLHTKRHAGPWRLVYQEELGSRREAMGRERELKSSRGRDWIRRKLERGC